MTDLQDRVLDAMVGAPAGRDWPGSIFWAAGEVAAPAPPRHSRRSDRGIDELARRLGYPRLFLEATHWASTAPKDEADQRGVAMALIRTVVPGGAPKRAPATAQQSAVLALYRGAHSLLCRDGECPVTRALDDILTAGAAPELLPDELACSRREIKSVVIDGIDCGESLQIRDPHGFDCCRAALRRTGTPGVYLRFAAQEAAFVAALAGGPAEAVALCQDFAKGLGMAVVA